MKRPTALMRSILVVELKQHQLAKQLRILKGYMQAEDITMLDRADWPLEIWIQYRVGSKLYEGTFMRAMLEAEVGGIQEQRDLLQ